MSTSAEPVPFLASSAGTIPMPSSFVAIDVHTANRPDRVLGRVEPRSSEFPWSDVCTGYAVELAYDEDDDEDPEDEEFSEDEFEEDEEFEDDDEDFLEDEEEDAEEDADTEEGDESDEDEDF